MKWIFPTLLVVCNLLKIYESNNIVVCKNININQAKREVATCTGAVLQGLPGDKGPPGEPVIMGSNTGRLPPGYMRNPEEFGRPGPKGDMGIKGVKGDAGGSGPPGPKGSIGLNGPIGAVGHVGPPGPKGEIGKPGMIGLVGRKGMVGDVGPPGPPGNFVKGAPGPQGQPGAKGNEGPPGYVNYTAIKTYIEQRSYERSCLGGLVYNNTCIRLPYTTGRVVTYGTTESLCLEDGGEVVEVFSEKMLDVIVDYVNMTWVENVDYPTIDHVTVWLRSTFEVSNNDEYLITLSSGRRIPLKRWRSNTPYKDNVNATRLKLYVVTIGGKEGSGIYNVDGGSAVPLCVHPL